MPYFTGIKPPREELEDVARSGSHVQMLPRTPMEWDAVAALVEASRSSKSKIIITSVTVAYIPGPVQLFVHKDMMARPSCCWRLLWAVDANAGTFSWAEGECSAHHFVRMADAIAHGKRIYGETAERFNS